MATKQEQDQYRQELMTLTGKTATQVDELLKGMSDIKEIAEYVRKLKEKESVEETEDDAWPF